MPSVLFRQIDTTEIFLQERDIAMAKKGAAATTSDREARSREFDSAELQELVNDVTRVADELNAAIAEMKVRKLAHVQVDGATKGQQGVMRLREFLAKLRYGIDRESIR